METINIYCLADSQLFFEQLLIKTFGNEIKSWTWYNNLDEFKSSTGRRIALGFLSWPITPAIEQELDQVHQSANATLIFINELHPETVNFIRAFDRWNITYYITGFLNFQLTRANVNFWPDWFITTTCFYKEHKPSVLFKLNPYDVKPYAFDALLGKYRPNRTQAYNFIKSNNLNGIVTYLDKDQPTLGNNTDKWIWESNGIENFEKVQNSTDSACQVNYHGYNKEIVRISQIIPIDIYNQTAYSLVCETQPHWTFLTEKTVKPILARRLFITIGSQFHLANLQSLGFKTFDGIIDESYDSIKDENLRVYFALEQLKWLCNQDQQDILNRCRDIVDHNFDLMYGQNWEKFNDLRLRFHITNQQN